MAKNTKKSLKQAKVKKKRWIHIFSPTYLGEKQIGETYLDEAENALGKTISVNLMHITGDIKNQNADVKFEVSDAKDNKLNTRLIRYTFSNSSIKRYVRRRMSRIDDSIVIMTKDNKKIRIKPFLLTRQKVSKSVQYNLRATLKEELIKLVKNADYDELFLKVIKYSIQKELKDKLNAIYPVKSLEIRILKEEKHHASKESQVGVKKVSKKLLNKDEEKKKKSAKEKTNEPAEEIDESLKE
ncbi:hypothetical protein JXC34_04345 [Candidatus Woesearchaeota archaeon]|nr:hypothetical protein [Candidatus Woesearchaeota archaeon]